jgi:hypothetical protein
MHAELEEKKRQYKMYSRAHWIVARMRWFTLILGPFPLIWDNFLWPFLESMGAPEFVTMEDLMQALLFNVVNIERWITKEEFEALWPHIVNICTALFIVFVFWTIKMKENMKEAAKKVISEEDRVHIGGYREY